MSHLLDVNCGYNEPMSAADVYRNQIRCLPVSERLRLASMILKDIPAEAVVDNRDDRSGQRPQGVQSGAEAEACSHARQVVEQRVGDTIFGPEEGSGTAEEILRSGALGGWAHRTDITDGRQFVDELRAQRRERRAAE
jgi:hypothetical protein